MTFSFGKELPEVLGGMGFGVLLKAVMPGVGQEEGWPWPGRGAHLRVGGPAASPVRPDGLVVGSYRAGSHPCVQYARHTRRVALKI